MKIETLNKFYDAATRVEVAKGDIADIAARLHDVGLEKLSKPLWAAAREFAAAAKMVRDAAGEAVNESVRASEKSTANMMAALFTGAAIKDPSVGDIALAFVAAAAHDTMTVDKPLSSKTEEPTDGAAD